MASQDVSIKNEGTDDFAEVTTELRLKVDTKKSNESVLAEARPGNFRSAFFVDGGASKDMNVDGTTPVEFKVVANTGKLFYIQTLIFTMVDASMNFSKFAGISSLSNGVKIEVQEGGNALGEATFSPITANKNFYEGGLKVNIQSEDKDILTALFSVPIQMGTSIELADARSDEIVITIQDDLQAVDQIIVVAQGYEVDE